MLFFWPLSLCCGLLPGGPDLLAVCSPSSDLTLLPVPAAHSVPLSVQWGVGMCLSRFPVRSVPHLETQFPSLYSLTFCFLIYDGAPVIQPELCQAPHQPFSAGLLPVIRLPTSLPVTTPRPSADTPQIPVSTRFFSSTGFPVLCHLFLGPQCITYLLSLPSASLTRV